MKEKELKELKLTKNIIIPFPNFQQNTIISPTQMNDNFEEIEHAYNTLIDNHNGALEKINKVLSDLTSSDNEAIVNEQERIEAEEIRVNNEEERIANEEERKTEETKRIAMYNVHLNDEIRREQKHIQMVGEFDTKVGEVDTLISTKTEEYNTFVETKEVEIQNAINSIPPKSELIGEKGDKGDKGEKGDKGDRGEQGLQGIQGIQGLQGVKGDKGDKGEQGIQGLKGDKGDKGDRGEQGVKGDTPSITHLETSINNKIQEVETRFNALTSTQQQSSEVIDARDGETSLKARLDRDIEKAKQVYVNVEGSHISTDSYSGYVKNVEIKGNTIQDASNLADIRSVGDKVEGQELYEIPVLSVGKNLFNDIFELGDISSSSGALVNSSSIIRNLNYIKIDGNTEYVASHALTGTISFRFYDKDLTYIGVGDGHTQNGNKTRTTSPNNAKYVKFRIMNTDISTQFQLEEGTVATEYEPYQEDKITILSPVQLEKVGDVADRIIEKDGVWGVEKNVVDKVLNGDVQLNSINLNTNNVTPNSVFTETTNPIIVDRVGNNRYSNWEDGKKDLWGKAEFDGKTVYSVKDNGVVQFMISKAELNSLTLDGVKQYLNDNNLLIKYPTLTPQFIPLPHDQQVKLRTFANKTNISFLTEIEGTIKAQVPKSLGATVNTHTEQISNLNKELDRVKKLEESTVSTVETKSDFTTVEATSNGYFEDVKLEGKTLVNLVDRYDYVTNQYYNTSYLNRSLLKPNTIYTAIVQNTCNNDIEVYCNEKLFKEVRFTIPANNFVIKKLSSLSEMELKDTAFLKNSRTQTEGFSYKAILLEGDHTQNPPSYFEGLKSVGDGADEIVVSSVNENLWNNGRITVDTNNVVPSNATSYVYLEKGEYRLSCKYTDDSDSTTHFRFNVKRNDRNGEVVLALGSMDRTISVDRNGLYYITIDRSSSYNGKFTSADIMLNKGTTPKPYTPHQSDKKRLLFYNNETQTWEKPILREWDSIEKHSDGKYYYHQRSGEVVLNGSEGWTHATSTIGDDLYARYYHNTLTTLHNSNFVCDMFKYGSASMTSFDGEGIGTQGNTRLNIKILKSKLSTQDVAGFKQWLQANNVTVVYQLAEEKVYECTNIDLITYANETNYIVECGAIAPKSTLKVHNNISNVVRTLQEKVSLLENKFIMGLKQVLAGDMYSLAELLYPEDFVSKEEPSDVPTLLI